MYSVRCGGDAVAIKYGYGGDVVVLRGTLRPDTQHQNQRTKQCLRSRRPELSSRFLGVGRIQLLVPWAVLAKLLHGVWVRWPVMKVGAVDSFDIDVLHEELLHELVFRCWCHRRRTCGLGLVRRARPRSSLWARSRSSSTALLPPTCRPSLRSSALRLITV